MRLYNLPILLLLIVFILLAPSRVYCQDDRPSKDIRGDPETVTVERPPSRQPTGPTREAPVANDARSGINKPRGNPGTRPVSPGGIPLTHIDEDELLIDLMDKNIEQIEDARAPILQFVTNYIDKYSSLIAEGSENAITAYPKVIGFAKVGSQALSALTFVSTVKDISEGKWGSGICFTIGLTPFPYGIIGSSICDITLITIRYKNEKKQ